MNDGSECPSPHELDAAVDNLQQDLFENLNPNCPDCFLHQRNVVEALQKDLENHPVTYPTSPCTH